MLVPSKCLFCDAENHPYTVLCDDGPGQRGSYPQTSGCGNYGLVAVGMTRHHLARCSGCGHVIWAINCPAGV